MRTFTILSLKPVKNRRTGGICTEGAGGVL